MTYQPKNPAHGIYRRFAFGLNDRITIDGCRYVPNGKKSKGVHYLNPVRDGLVGHVTRAFSDEEIAVALRDGRLAVDEAYYSRASTELRHRYGESDLADLREDQARTLWWQMTWVDAFLTAHADRDADWRPNLVRSDAERWIEENREKLHSLYIAKFDEARRPGRKIQGRPRKQYDWPAASTLLDWIATYEAGDYKIEALRPKTDACGNRNQIDPEVERIIEKRINYYCTPERPTMEAVIGLINGDLMRANRNRPADRQLRISANAIRNRIRKLSPFVRELGRYGKQAARMRYLGVGKGIAPAALHPMHRVECDDWEVDLFALVRKSSFFREMSRKQRAAIPRIRLNVTAAIDCCTKAVVGLSVAPHAPTTATTRATIRSVLTDKTPLAEWVGAQSPWPMHGPFRQFVTDGGPANLGDVNDAVRLLSLSRTIPEADPRKRGTIESFFCTLKHICVYFAGRAFSNVVEKGDYAAEDLASLTVAEFHKAIIRWIVDVYHQRGHSGLNGLTPFAAWHKFGERGPGIAIGPSAKQMAIAFGFRRSGSIDRSGLRYANLAYNSSELAKLHRMTLAPRLLFWIDPEDMGAIFVLVPKPERRLFDGEHFLRVPSIDPDVRGRSLVDLMLVNKRYRELARQAQEQGKPIRLQAETDLYEDGQAARRRAGIPSGFLTAAEVDLFDKACDRAERAAFEDVDHAETPTAVGPDSFGQEVALPSRKRPRVEERETDRDPAPAPSNAGDADASDETSGETRPDERQSRPASSAINLFTGDDE